MRAYDIIYKKRNGEKLKEEEIEWFIDGFLKGDVEDYQMSAFLMAVFFSGMDFEETFALTKVMLNSGDVISFEGITTVDKHSTGGVGDKVSIVLAPLVASCGAKIPMMSGRGLGHTGGTLDKLESIPGFRVEFTREEIYNAMKKVGVAIVGQTGNIAPADKRIYALRDTTATIDSIPLITASIMSKKLAEGTDSLVLDVKFGSGAFMKEYDKARSLAEYMINVAKLMGKKSMAVLTSMEQPLGYAIGNTLEIIESIECLKGNFPPDLKDVVFELGKWMLILSDIADNEDDAMNMLRQNIDNGKALDKFIQMVENQGGDAKVVDDYNIMPHTDKKIDVFLDKSGYISYMQTDNIGIAGVLLGAGREKIEDSISYDVGIVIHKKIGDYVDKDTPIATFYYNERSKLDSAIRLFKESIKVEANSVEKIKLIREVIR